MGNMLNEYPKGIGMLIESEKFNIINKFFHIKSLNFLNYQHQQYLVFIDLFYFSSSTFFTVGYGDMTLTGLSRIFAILESLVGVSFTAIFVSLTIIKYTTPDPKQEVIKLKISRGWDVLNLRKQDKTIKILLLSECNIKENYQVVYEPDFLELLYSFKTKWDFNPNDLATLNNQLLRFCIYLYEEMSNSGLKMSHKILVHYLKKTEINLQELSSNLADLLQDKDEVNKLDSDVTNNCYFVLTIINKIIEV